MTNNELIIINEESIKDKIYEIRGVKVMLDFELAELYGYETKNFNNQVKRNKGKFPVDFMFKLNSLEFNQILRLQNATSSWGGKRYLPYAFTEQGIYMLMTVLRGELAIKQSIAIIRTFKAMKDYLVESNNLITSNELLKLSRQVHDDSNAIVELKKDNVEIKNQLNVVMDNFIDPSKYKHFVIMNGQRIEADIAYQQIFLLAKSNIILVDDYISVKTLKHLKVCSKNINITIISDNISKEKIDNGDLNDFYVDTRIDIKLIPTHAIVHDRYIVIDFNTDDEVIYDSGTSLKDAGNKITSIKRLEFPKSYHDIIEQLLKNA